MRRWSLTEKPVSGSFEEAVRDGLAARPRRLPPRFFYDGEGTALFDLITTLPEYYVTRTEMDILRRHAAAIDPPSIVIEFGGGSGAKTALLFDAWLRGGRRMRYVPVDISSAALVQSAEALLAAYPRLSIHAINAEFEQALEVVPAGPSLVLFLGSNIGNFDGDEAVRFLSALRGRRVLVGFDMEKDPAILHAAYNDAAGITARFNKNLLVRINGELGGDFRLDDWEHLAYWNAAAGRIEMHLVASRAQTVTIAALRQAFTFEAGERIHTENSYKFSPAGIEALARASGFRVVERWTDERAWFSVALLA